MKERGYAAAPVFAVLLACATSAHGGEQAMLEEEIIVIGAMEKRITEGRKGSYVALDREDLTRANFLDVTSALRTISGVSVSRQGGPGGISSVYVRGGEANFTPVLLNGIQVNDPGNSRGGAYNFDHLDIGSIERIEILRGTQSTSFGSDSLAGLINIVTTDDQGEPKVALELGGNSENGEEAALRIGGDTQAGSVALGLRTLDSGETVEGFSNQVDFYHLGYSLPAGKARRYSLNAFMRFADAERTAFPEDSGGPELAVLSALDHGDTQEFTGGLSLTSRAADDWRIHANLGWHKIDDEVFSPGIFPFDQVPPNFSDSDFSRYSAALRAVRDAGPWGYSFGIDARVEDGRSDGYVEFFGSRIPSRYELSREIYGAFFDVRRSLGSADLSASFRLDDADTFASESAASLGIAHPLFNERTWVSVNWAEGYKLPSFFALGNSLVGNPALRPERSEGIELNIEHRFAAFPASVALSYFNNDYEDLIDFDPATFTNVNRSSVSVSGLEGSADVDVTARLSASLQATYVDYDTPAGVRLRGRPSLQVSAQASYRIIEDLLFFAGYRWLDEVLQSSLVTGPVALSSHSVWDFNFRYTPREGTSLNLTLENALDESYREGVGTPAPERWLRFTLRHEFQL